MLSFLPKCPKTRIAFIFSIYNKMIQFLSTKFNRLIDCWFLQIYCFFLQVCTGLPVKLPVLDNLYRPRVVLQICRG